MTISRSVNVTVLALCFFFMVSSNSLAQRTVSSNSSKEKSLVLQFPADQSYGVIIKLDNNWNIQSKKLTGPKFADAKGKVELPLHEPFMLVPNYNCITHPEVLTGLPANSFVSLTLDKIEAEDKVMPCIGKLTGLKRLDLNDTEVSDKGLEALSSLPNLQVLQLREGSFTGSFLAHCAPLKKLKHLWLNGCKLDTKFLDRYSSVLPAITVIHLSGDQLKDQDLLFLEKFPYLEELHLDRNKYITDSGLKYILQCKQIGFLNLDNTAVTANGLKALAALKLKTIMVPHHFSKNEFDLVKKAMKNTVVATGGPVGTDNYQLFAPLH